MKVAFARRGLACWPGKLTRWRKVHTPMHAVDWMPTLVLALAGKWSRDLKWDGIEHLAVHSPSRSKAFPVRTLYTAAPGFRAEAVRHGDWKLIVTHEGKKKNKSLRRRVVQSVQRSGRKRKTSPPRPEKLAEMKPRFAEIPAATAMLWQTINADYRSHSKKAAEPGRQAHTRRVGISSSRFIITP